MIKTDHSISAIHGWGSAPAVWEGLLGDLEHVHQPSFHHVAQPDDLYDSVVEMLPREGSLVLAWSMGAMLAIEAALDWPEAVDALVLFGGCLRFENHDRTLGWPERIIRRMQEQLVDNPDEVLTNFHRRMFSPAERSDREAFLERFDGVKSLDFETDGLSAGLDYLIATDLHERINDLVCPVLWIHGDEDPICPAAALAELPKHHQTVNIPGAGHLPFYTRTSEVRWMIEEFCREIR